MNITKLHGLCVRHLPEGGEDLLNLLASLREQMVRDKVAGATVSQKTINQLQDTITELEEQP